MTTRTQLAKQQARAVSEASAARTRCEHKTETLRWGRNVADFRQCRRVAASGERYCWQHGGARVS